MDFQPTKPKDAAAVILLNHRTDQVLWARRNPNLRFLGGFHSFPGGKLDETDHETEVRNCTDQETKGLIACAARETFEEVGVLLVRNGDRLTKGQIPLLHDDLISGRNSFAEILDLWGLWLDADDFNFAGVWTTPDFSRMRFRTSFFAARCPAKQEPYAAITELQEVEFVNSDSALKRWSRSTVLLAPPVLSALQTMDDHTSYLENPSEDVRSKAKRFYQNALDAEHGPHFLDFNSRLICLPLRTKTLPPATHTNCFIFGKRKFVVIDAATPFEDEQIKLFEVVDSFIKKGNKLEAIIVSHLHPDHFGGETALKKHIFERFSVEAPIVGHRLTIESLKGKVEFDKEIKDSYVLQDKEGTEISLDVLHTPGHAQGHLCFYDRENGFLLSSDNVVGEGTVVIAPPEGNMIDYLRSLEEMKALPGLRSLCGSHGAAVSDAEAKIDSYIKHRLEREAQILESISNGANDVQSIVKVVYPDLDPQVIPLAEKTVEAHLAKIRSDRSFSVDWSEVSIS